MLALWWSGDPKQAIYRFRGADIFTYLKAADEASERFNLGTNYLFISTFSGRGKSIIWF